MVSDNDRDKPGPIVFLVVGFYEYQRRGLMVGAVLAILDKQYSGLIDAMERVKMTAKEGYMAGLGKLGAGDLDGAIGHFQAALEVDDTFFMGHLGWAQALDRQGKVDAAIEQVKQAIVLAPDEALAHTSLSRLYQQKGMIPEAEEEMAISQRLSALG